MKIAFCTPFKPVNHPSISGDVTIARDLYETLRGFGHDVQPVEYFSARTIYRKPGTWVGAGLALKRMVRQARDADCWLTYGSYYKVPDVFGPLATQWLKMPYFIFQASYAEERGKRISTWPGFALNRRAMLKTDHIFCNRVNDLDCCAKLLPESRYSYVKPGLPDDMFKRNEPARAQLRAEWHVTDTPVVITAAMMRPGVKAQGLHWVIKTCADLVAKGRNLTLVIAGDGPRRGEMEALAYPLLKDRVRFLGMVDRDKLNTIFSAGDIFAFPGLEESVGMVYLEAQQCGLPVVATDDEGAPYVIDHGHSGIVTSATRTEFTEGVDRLVSDVEFRKQLGKQAMDYAEQNHNANTNYKEMERIMKSVVNQRRSAQ
ncbi:MAG: glycosyltransferase family 4 protein [Pseudodesulfovibrio sp.]|nr:glycosyltransferase family 4 protein [Pseudodesulfovibrio sp.]